MKTDNKARDIFYGVVAVATLIVALVGATLAYFSISASSNEGAVNATAATVSIDYKDGQQVTAQADQLIPATLDVVKQIYEEKVKDIDPESPLPINACTDANEEQVCSAYRFTVRSDQTRTVTATLNSEHNGFTYLGYAVYDVTNGAWLELDDNKSTDLGLTTCSNEVDEEGNPDEITDCYVKEGTVKTYKQPAVNSIFGLTTEDGMASLKTKSVSSATQTYDIVLFIKENDNNQNIDQGQNYRGTIIVDVVDGGMSGQITGSVTKTQP